MKTWQEFLEAKFLEVIGPDGNQQTNPSQAEYRPPLNPQREAKLVLSPLLIQAGCPQNVADAIAVAIAMANPEVAGHPASPLTGKIRQVVYSPPTHWGGSDRST